MDIGFYIADLLRKQDEVVLPGLGTFTKQKVHGSYDSISNSFSPPSYKVSFSKEVSNSNSISEYISLKKKLSTSSAEYFVKKFTTGIFDGLQTSGIAELSPLGIIRQQNENLTFEASPNFVIPGKFYGLKPVYDAEITAQPPVQDISAPSDEPSASIEDFITGLGATNEIEEEDVYVPERKSNRTLLLILGALLFTVVVVGILYFFNPSTKNFIDRMIPASVSSDQLPADSVKISLPPAVAGPDSLSTLSTAVSPDSSQNNSAATASSAEKETLPEPEIIKIEIIGATFGKRSEAETYVRTMKTKGIEAKIADDMPGKLFKVSLGSFSDEQTAQNELNRIVDEVEQTAWIAKYKSKKNQ